MYPRCVVSKEDIGAPGEGTRNDEFRDERLRGEQKCQIEARTGGMGGTDCDIPWVGEFPEDDGVEERGDMAVFGGIFE